MVNNTDILKLSQVSSFFHTEKAIGIIQFSEPKRLAFINEKDGVWIADDSEFSDLMVPIIDELNVTQDKQFALAKIRKAVVKDLYVYYSEKLENFQNVLNQVKTKLLIELSSNKFLDKINGYFDELVVVTKSKSLMEIDELSDYYHKFNGLFIEFSLMIEVKKKAIRYIKELVRLLAGTSEQKEAGNIAKNSVKVDIGRANMEKILDEAKIWDFESCSDVINLAHIINAIHKERYSSAQEVIKSFHTAV